MLEYVPDTITPSTHVSEPVILEDGIEVHHTKSYGIGIDCHSKFIQVSVLVKRDMRFFEYRNTFSTAWEGLVLSKSWCMDVIKSCSDPVPDLTVPFHYVIESTSVYHMPVLLAWEGTPSVINPTLAGATKRKTDVLDAKLLALHDLTGVWPESYLPSSDVKELRLLVNERNRYVHEATACSNRINNAIVRFGFTIGREGSVTKSPAIRAAVETEASETPVRNPDVCPIPIPANIRALIRSEYQKYDSLTENGERWLSVIQSKVMSMEWETATSTLPGSEMLSLLTTAPQVGDLTAITWLVHIVTPRRFPNSKAVAAYCGLDPSLKVSAGHVTSSTKRGGCRPLHNALVSCGDRLIRNHTEMFGRWGYNLYCQTGKWKKASNAVARKLAVALYYMMLTGQPFSYENYNLAKDIVSFNIPVAELVKLNPDFKRYIRILEEHDIHTTSDLVTSYLTCSLSSYKGLGRKFFVILRDFMNHQHKYKEEYERITSESEKNVPS